MLSFLKYLSLFLLWGVQHQHSSVDARIIGGETVFNPEERFPYHAFLIFCDDEGFCGYCGGSVIAPDIILSAAHCDFFNAPYSSIEVNIYFDTPIQVNRTCETWVNHPDYNPDFNGAPFALDNDWALCKLNEPVAIDQSQVILELNQDEWFPYDGEDVTLIGLGVLSDETFDLPEQLQLANDIYISNAVCNDTWAQATVDNNLDVTYSVSEDMLCTFTENEEIGICGEDSGSPAIIIEGHRHIHVGVASWGPPACGIFPYPSVFARTSTGYSWIRDTACNELDSIGSLCLPTPSRSSKKDKSASKSAKKRTKKSAKSAKKGRGGKSMSSKQSRAYTLSIFENESGLTEEEGWQD